MTAESASLSEVGSESAETELSLMQGDLRHRIQSVMMSVQLTVSEQSLDEQAALGSAEVPQELIEDPDQQSDENYFELMKSVWITEKEAVQD